jgi:hypothetical protein
MDIGFGLTKSGIFFENTGIRLWRIHNKIYVLIENGSS